MTRQRVTVVTRPGRERGSTTLMVTHDAKIIDLADRIVADSGEGRRA